MVHVAWDLFGKTPESWQRVQAVLDWVHGNVAFGYQFARPSKTAFDVYTERQGVCRDFQHLAITFLRALNIPARYVTGYLGVPLGAIALIGRSLNGGFADGPFALSLRAKITERPASAGDSPALRSRNCAVDDALDS